MYGAPFVSGILTVVVAVSALTWWVSRLAGGAAADRRGVRSPGRGGGPAGALGEACRGGGTGAARGAQAPEQW